MQKKKNNNSRHITINMTINIILLFIFTCLNVKKLRCLIVNTLKNINLYIYLICF